jgi:hypothetical protein
MNEWFEYRSNRLIISIFGPIGLLIIVGAFFLYDHISASQTLNSSLEILNSINDNFKIEINGEKVENKFILLKELKKVKIVSAHHSHPTEKIDIEIIAQSKTYNFQLRRDSKIKNEYWVYHLDKSHEIGRIRTRIFDRY